MVRFSPIRRFSNDHNLGRIDQFIRIAIGLAFVAFAVKADRLPLC